MILFKQTGDAPILKQNKVKVRAAAAAVLACLQKLMAPSCCRLLLFCTATPRRPTQPSPAQQVLHDTLLQISGQDPFSKLVDFLRKKLGRDQVVGGRSAGRGSCAHRPCGPCG